MESHSEREVMERKLDKLKFDKRTYEIEIGIYTGRKLNVRLSKMKEISIRKKAIIEQLIVKLEQELSGTAKDNQTDVGEQSTNDKDDQPNNRSEDNNPVKTIQDDKVI